MALAAIGLTANQRAMIQLPDNLTIIGIVTMRQLMRDRRSPSVSRTGRWLISLLAGGSAFALAWWIVEALVQQDRSTALSVAAVVASLLTTPLTFWAGREPGPAHVDQATGSEPTELPPPVVDLRESRIRRRRAVYPRHRVPLLVRLVPLATIVAAVAGVLNLILPPLVDLVQAGTGESAAGATGAPSNSGVPASSPAGTSVPSSRPAGEPSAPPSARGSSLQGKWSGTLECWDAKCGLPRHEIAVELRDELTRSVGQAIGATWYPHRQMRCRGVLKFHHAKNGVLYATENITERPADGYFCEQVTNTMYLSITRDDAGAMIVEYYRDATFHTGSVTARATLQPE